MIVVLELACVPHPLDFTVELAMLLLRCYLGAAHGIAGILHTLLQLPAELALVLKLRAVG